MGHNIRKKLFTKRGFCVFLNFFIFLVLSMASLCADDDSKADRTDHLDTSTIVLQIISEQAESIQCHDYENGKLYLKAERICPANNQIWLYDDISAISIPALFMDQNGYYILCRKRGERPYRCPSCGRQWYFSEDPTYYCRVCLERGE